jgi:membrane protease YdiL (CAAX protease family)
MGTKSEIIGEDGFAPQAEPAQLDTTSRARDLLEIGVVFAFLVAAVWTHQGALNSTFSICAAASVVGFAIAGRWSSREMGLTGGLTGAWKILLIGAGLCGLIWLAGLGLGFAGAGSPIPFSRSWEYAIWALIQEFILQSLFFTRLESIFGGRRAMVYSASLYAMAHLPNPVLAPLSFVGGLIFCDLFRRYRNLFPIGIIHAALGVTIAASLPEPWLHHMRVGIGYLATH